jgi:hypothetical protein
LEKRKRKEKKIIARWKLAEGETGNFFGDLRERIL